MSRTMRYSPSDCISITSRPPPSPLPFPSLPPSLAGSPLALGRLFCSLSQVTAASESAKAATRQIGFLLHFQGEIYKPASCSQHHPTHMLLANCWRTTHPPTPFPGAHRNDSGWSRPEGCGEDRPYLLVPSKRSPATELRRQRVGILK